MARPRIIEPHLSTPAPDGGEPTATGYLPDALLSEQVQRLAVCTVVGAGLWSYGLVMDTMVRPLTVTAAVPGRNVIIEIVAIALSVMMFLYVRYVPHAPQKKTDIGLLYFVVNAIGVALLNTSSRTATIDSMGQLSWNTVVILVFLTVRWTSGRTSTRSGAWRTTS